MASGIKVTLVTLPNPRQSEHDVDARGQSGADSREVVREAFLQMQAQSDGGLGTARVRSVFVGGKRLKTTDDKGRKGRIEFLVVISNEKSHDLWEDYRLRWKIETLFQALKGRGFALESCRLSKENRLSGWFGFLALALCWCLKVGRLLDEIKPLTSKKHGRRAISVFQRGLNELESLLGCLTGRPSHERFCTVLMELCTV